MADVLVTPSVLSVTSSVRTPTFNHRPANDDFSRATNLGNSSTVNISDDNTYATAEASEPDNQDSGQPAVNSMWYTWTAPASTVVSIDLFDSVFDTLLGVYTGTSLASLVLIADNDDTQGLTSQVVFQAVAGTEYKISVGGYDIGEFGVFYLNIEQAEASFGVVQYATKIISYNPLLIIGGVSPVTLTKINILSPSFPSFHVYNINGISNATGVVIDETNNFIYISGAEGKIAKIDSTDLTSYSILDVTDASNFMKVAVFPDQNIAYGSTNENTGEIYLIDFKDSTTIDTDFQVLTELRSSFDSYFNTIESLPLGRTVNTSFECLGTNSTTISTNFFLLPPVYSGVEGDYIALFGSPAGTNIYNYVITQPTVTITGLETQFPGQGTTIFNTLLAQGYIESNGNIVFIDPIGREDWHVYIDDVQLASNDIDLKSIEITHTIDEQSRAVFTLARRHDQLNTNFNGLNCTITNQNTVKIYIGSNLEFNGKIGELSAIYDKSTEKVIVTAYMDQPTEQYNSVLLPLPGLTENRNLYHIILQNPQIFNPYINPTELNPRKYLGIRAKLGKRITESILKFKAFTDTSQLADDIISGAFKPKQNWTYFWFAGVTKIQNPQIVATTPTTSQTGTSQGIFADIRAEISSFFQANQVLFHDLFTSTQALFESAGVNFSSFPAYTRNTILVLQYVGTSLGGLTSQLWDLRNATYYYQRERDSIEYKLGTGTITVAELEEEFPGKGTVIFSDIVSNGYADGSGNITEKFKTSQSSDDYESNYGKFTIERIYGILEDKLGYTVGSPPYKDVSTRNGVYIATEKWSDETDGLYVIKADSYNFINYVQKIADLEYKKIQNINGSILPITKATIKLTLDAYYFYRLKLLTRINIDNTTTANIYNGNNGFPVAIKSITLNSNDMVVSLDTDNQKSSIELAAIDGEYPDEGSEEFNTKGYFRRQNTKYDLQTGDIIV